MLQKGFKNFKFSRKIFSKNKIGQNHPLVIRGVPLQKRLVCLNFFIFFSILILVFLSGPNIKLKQPFLKNFLKAENTVFQVQTFLFFLL